jgi:hypothetical protein
MMHLNGFFDFQNFHIIIKMYPTFNVKIRKNTIFTNPFQT